MVLSLLLFLPFLVSGSFNSTQFENKSVDRVIDLSGRYPRIINTVVFQNKGSSASKYYYAIPTYNLDKIAHMRAYLKDAPYNNLEIDFVPHDVSGWAVFKIKIAKGVDYEASQELVIEEVLNGKLRAFPEKIDIFDSQLLLFEDNIHMGSPYVTNKAVTRVQFPTPQIESYSQPEDKLFDLKGKELTYGPYEKVLSYGNFSFYLHYEHSIALPHFNRVERRIEVSHWGNIAVDEFYNLENLGAQLQGEFSRVDFTARNRPSGMNALESLEAVLPRTAWGLYFRDELGNVSTSHARQHTNYVELEVEPRFPVMGGWRSNMNIGYNLPISYFVKSKESQFMLNTTFGIPFTDIVADELIVRVILPEGSWDIKPILPFKVEEMYFETLYSYMDIVGRPVLVLHKKNAVDFHRKPFQVLYKFEKSSLLMEPIYLSGLVLGVLLMQICYFRMSLRIESESKVKTE